MTNTQRALARTFRALHHGPDLLVLPNAWDAGSARLVEACGAPAIATSSAAMSWAHGVPDGEHLDVDVLLATVREIVRAVRIPVSVDVERGYSNVAELISAVIDAGAIGINLEDGSDPSEVLAAKIEAVREVATRRGVELFVNARTDVYLRGLVPNDRAVDEVIRRGTAYVAAGCDGLFVPRLVDSAAITAIASAVRVPLNVLAMPELAPMPELHALGVRRVSVGTGLAQAALATVRKATTELLGHRPSAMFAERIPVPELNALFAR
ncbi:isocitrate lyase/PEP mutase family protein [Sandaracinus amylolyticus]|uniref:isocitrate lyase/PEP mutase family protein n=1 Tax=Sandaracinus amylolyticus TaxID=927083 RepID=UPI001F37A75A|nr:isocitrate lyase/phosphoenolpyruvate mutase family protein [Sandaracinus amylolyticus]UJR80977.1 Carboxyvinyl-carboxyphosphonate phosphorylmutase [Sandaracinus amylolyticus]